MTPHSTPAQTPSNVGRADFYDIDQHRLRILRCTARFMASSPGGLRFQAGARPWLEGLAPTERHRGDRAQAG